MIDEIKQTDIWSKLMSNPKFEIEFERFINNSSYQLDINDLVFSIENNKLTVSYSTDIKERDLDCQYRLFVQKEFYVDDEVNLIVNELSGVLESNYGYDFDNTIGGIINTHYSAIQYDIDGIELNYQSYSDKYHLDNRQFKTFRNDIRDVILNAYNPNLLFSISLPRPNIIGKEGRFIKQTRNLV